MKIKVQIVSELHYLYVTIPHLLSCADAGEQP